jgi:hypothetical protein
MLHGILKLEINSLEPKKRERRNRKKVKKDRWWVFVL